MGYGSKEIEKSGHSVILAFTHPHIERGLTALITVQSAVRR